MSELVTSPGESEIAIHRDIPRQYRLSVDGNRSGSPWYEAVAQMEAVHPGQARELVWSAECWPVELAGWAFAETKPFWLVRVIRGVEPARLWPVAASWVELEALEASPPIPEGRSATTARAACAGDSPSLHG